MIRIWEQAPVKQRNRLLKTLIRGATVDARAKRVKYSLSIPLAMLIQGLAVVREGREEGVGVMAEAIQGGEGVNVNVV